MSGNLLILKHSILPTLGIAILFLFFVRCTSDKSTIATFTPLDSEKEKVELINLGRELFFDKKLSVDHSIACANCHIPVLAFTDGDSVSIGVHGRRGKRNSPSLFNVANQDLFMWDGGVKTLELQALVPLQDTNEMAHRISKLIPELAKIPFYDSLAQLIEGKSFNPNLMTRALGAFQRSLYREESLYDRWQRGEKEVNESIQAGYELFTGRLNCVSCHAPPTFTTNALENNGLYETYKDQGRYRITGDSSDIGKFKVPSLRNVEITAPYMHDGSMKTLEEVIGHYASGGSNNPNKSQLIQGFELSEKEEKQLILFLKSLSDESIQKQWSKVFNSRY
jgi:cytochrome c peroxidase